MLSWTTERSTTALSPMRTFAAQGAEGTEACARADDAVVADHRGTLDDRTLGSISAPLPTQMPGPQREPVDVDLDLAVEDVLVGAQVGLQGPDVLPVAVGHVPVEVLAGGQCGRERLAGEVHRLALGDVVEDLRLEHVDAGVDRVAEDLAPGRLLQEPLDASRARR